MPPPPLLPAECTVLVAGPDAKALKGTHAAFHAFRDGRTTLSCSGMLLLLAGGDAGSTPSSSCDGAAAASPAPPVWRVLAPLSCLFPFLQASQRRQQLADVTADSLLPGVEVSVLLRPQGASTSSSSSALVRVPARLAAVLPLRCVQAAAEQLLMATNAGSSGGAWRLGWALADRQPLAAGTSAVLGHVMLLELQADAVGSMTGLQPHFSLLSSGPTSSSSGSSRGGAAAACACSAGSSSCSLLGRVGRASQGQGVAMTGSPFACLAAQQFHGAVVTGCVSLVLPPSRPGAAAAAAGAVSGQPPPLFVVDGRCLPGMEGGPVRCRCCGALLGVLGLPLTNSSSQVELLLAVSAHHLGAALQEALPRLQQRGKQEQLAAAASAAGADGNLHRQQAAAVGSVCRGQHHQRATLAAAGALRRLRVHMQQLTAHEQQPPPLLTAAPTAAAVLNSPQQASHGLSSSMHSAAAVLQAAAAGVVMVRAGRSWGSGVLITHSGLVLTVAHLFRSSAPAAAAAGATAAAGDNASLQSGSHQVPQRSCVADTPAQQQQVGAVLEARLSESSAERHQQQDVSVLLSVPGHSSGNSRRALWLPAQVLHCFTGHLDLAVLQVDQAHMASLGSGGSLRPLQLAGRADTVSPGDAVFVIGHGLFGPRLAWPPAITGGCVARVLSIPTPVQQHQQPQPPPLGHPGQPGGLKPSMVISTAAVHAGASGGALVDASGRLQGLVTSNARHARGATLPHLNFSISAAELRPVWEWAHGGSRAQGLAALDVKGDTAAARLWALQPFA